MLFFILQPLLAQEAYQPELNSAIKRAQDLYKNAARCYEEGSSDHARELFRKSLQTLLSINADANTYYNLKDEFNKLLEGFGEYSPEPSRRFESIPVDFEDEKVRMYIKRFSSGLQKIEIQKAFEKSGKYRTMILKILEQYNLPLELIYLPIVESQYNINNKSKAGALGLWQLMPQRARALGLKVNYWVDERKDPEKSTLAAAQYLQYLYFMFDDWHLALAGYNRGEYGLVRDMESSNGTNIHQLSSIGILPEETESFVPQFIACVYIGNHSRNFNDDLQLEEPVGYDEVIINDVIDLGIAAKCAGSSLSVIRELNPALKAWSTPPNYPGFVLRIPRGTKSIFLSNIAAIKDFNPSPGYIKYTTISGDNLIGIAKKFYTSPRLIKKDNRLANPDNLETGQILMVRPGKKYFENPQ